MLNSPFGLTGDIDFAFMQPLAQIIGRQINQNYFVRGIEVRARKGSPDLDTGE